MAKLQTSFSYTEAKEAAVGRLTMLINLGRSLKEHNQGLVLDVSLLEATKFKLETEPSVVLSDSEIKRIADYGIALLSVFPELYPKLQAFWQLTAHIMINLKREKSQSGFDFQFRLHQMTPRILEADSLANRLVSETGHNSNTVTVALSLLFVNIIRTESIEYPISRQLLDAIKLHKLQGYDVEEMCSVGNKISKGVKWVSDVRAIRDATAHGHFEINSTNNYWEIIFHNNEEGYAFNESFNRREFITWFNSHSMLYKLQVHIWGSFELNTLLATHFSSKNKTSS